MTVRFANSMQNRILIKVFFTELKDLNYFKDFQIVFGTVQWQNEQDFAPETLYIESELLELKS
jgi:hypothetical protein